MNSKKLIFANQNVAIYDDGSYERTLISLDALKAEERTPANQQAIRKAKRAQQLGLDVPIPEPEWTPDPRLPIGGTREEIEETISKAVQSSFYREDLNTGGEIFYAEQTQEDWDRSARTYGEATGKNKIACGWDVVGIPEEWSEKTEYGTVDRKILEVQSSCGRWKFRGWIRGSHGRGTLISAHYAKEEKVPGDVLELVERVNTEREQRWQNKKTDADARELAELKAFFKV